MNIEKVKTLVAELQSQLQTNEIHKVESYFQPTLMPDSEKDLEMVPLNTGTSESRTVKANVTWNATGINVRAGDRVDIWADDNYLNVWKISDAVRCGPDGDSRYTAKPYYALPGYPEGCLVARIGSSVYHIGRSGYINVAGAGELLLSANDDLDGRYGSGYRDNSGGVVVKIRVR